MADVYAGWVFLIKDSQQTSGQGKPAGSSFITSQSVPRFMVLAQQTLLMYRKDPNSSPGEQAKFSGLVTEGTSVEVQGRRVLPNGQVLHVFSFASGPSAVQQAARKVEIGCSTAEAAHQWVSVIDSAATGQQRSRESTPVANRSVDRSGPWSRVVSIGSAQVHPSAADDDEGDASDNIHWKLIRLLNGLRIFEGVIKGEEESNNFKLLKAEGVVEAEPDRIFELIMNLNEPSRMQWDILTLEADVLEVIDGFTDVVHATYVHGKGKRGVREIVAKRKWRRNQDGSYVISFFPDEASTKAIPIEKSTRFDNAVFSWDIVPIAGGKAKGSGGLSSCYPRSLVRYVLEVQLSTSSILGKFRPHINLPFFRKDKEKERTKEREKEKAKDKEKERSLADGSVSMRLPSPVTAAPAAHEFLAEPGALEEFGDGVPLLSLLRIAGLREYFASLPPPALDLRELSQASAVRSEAHAFSGLLASDSVSTVAGDEFFDALEHSVAADVDTQKRAEARKRWLRIRWLVKFGAFIHSLADGGATGLSWNVQRELLHKCPPVSLEDKAARLAALGSVPHLSAPNTLQNGMNSWRDPGGADFHVRGPNYLTDHAKIAAGEPLLRLVAMDWFTDPDRIDNIAARPGCLVQSEVGKSLPFIFVFNIQVPGPPYHCLVSYFASDRPIRAHPRSLLHKFYSSKDDEFRNRRFKLIPRIAEGHWMVKRAVGSKPCILGKALKCAYFRGGNYLEMDCDIGSSSVARNVLGLVISYVTTLVVDMVLLIEAQEAEELPEYLLAAMTCIRMDTKKAVPPPAEAVPAASDVVPIEAPAIVTADAPSVEVAV